MPMPVGIEFDEHANGSTQDEPRRKKIVQYGTKAKANVRIVGMEEGVQINTASSSTDTAPSSSKAAPSPAKPSASSAKEKERESDVARKKRKRVSQLKQEPVLERIAFDDVNGFAQDNDIQSRRTQAPVADSETKARANIQTMEAEPDTEEEVGDSDSEEEVSELFTRDEVQAKINASLRPLLERVGALKMLVREAVEAQGY